MSWEYRVTRTTDPDGSHDFAIREVYFDDDTDLINGWSENPVSPSGLGLPDLMRDMARYQGAFGKDVLAIESNGLFNIGPTGDGAPVLQLKIDTDTVVGHVESLSSGTCILTDEPCVKDTLSNSPQSPEQDATVETLHERFKDFTHQLTAYGCEPTLERYIAVLEAHRRLTQPSSGEQLSYAGRAPYITGNPPQGFDGHVEKPFSVPPRSMNEQSCAERLSLILTNGNASEWEHIFHAAETLRAEVESLKAEIARMKEGE